MEPLEGTLPEPEIWARLVRALDVVDDARLEPLRAAALAGRKEYAQAVAEATAGDPALARVLPYALYETLGPTLPEGMASAAALWGLAQRVAMIYPDAMRRAGHADGDALFEAILEGRSGITFTVDEYEDDFAYVVHPDKRIALEIPQMLAELRALADRQPGLANDDYPVVLSVGERRSYTANDIFRDPGWRKRDADGALRVSGEDAERFGLKDGGRARITTTHGNAEATVEVNGMMRPGHASLPNGYGLDFTDDAGRTRVPGVAPNSLTSSDWRDPFAGTPWHKHVPARIEPVAATSSTQG
jgi:anaerobic selenocysteine-containing dehydrogenase